MADNTDNILVRDTRGAIGKTLVFKKINGKSVTTKYPDMSRVQYSKEQLKSRSLFSEAVAFALEILEDPVREAAYRQKILKDKGKYGTSVYHVAISDFMNEHSKRVPEKTVKDKLKKYRQSHTLSDRQAKGLEHLLRQGSLTNAVYQRLNGVSKATATRDLQSLVRQGLLSPAETRGAGAVYRLADQQDKE